MSETSEIIGRRYVPAWRHERQRETLQRTKDRMRELAAELRAAKRRLDDEVAKLRREAAEREEQLREAEALNDHFRNRVAILTLKCRRQGELLTGKGAA